MQQIDSRLLRSPTASIGCLLTAALTTLLSACGGGGGATAEPGATATADTAAAAATTTADVSAGIVAQPSFHIAPALLDDPGNADAVDNSSSARQQPHIQSVSGDMAALSSQRLTAQSIGTARRQHALGLATPSAASSSVSTYTPAQIRAAYGLPEMPAAGMAPTAAQAAQLGAGQTIYIVDAMHDPNAAAELAAFSEKFGLPACTTLPIASSASLPLAAAKAANGCTFSVVYSTAAGGMTATAPRYDSGWATEIALDVQWVHATAPLARIVLIESADASVTNLAGAVKLANAMGPGVVSMSFGATEGSWTASMEPTFTGSAMTYLAATGDAGAQVSWPAVSPNVLAVGGTRLSYSGVGSRSEVGWSSTGGGISAYTATPAYQSNAVPGIGTLAHRAVADVAFNADPGTGQYVAVKPAGATAVNWLSAGGTSLATPQWAGLIAVANALRAGAGKAPVGAPHAVLYGRIAAVPGNFAGAFADITSGANGSCSACSAKIGYDVPTGLGTPNGSSLLGMLVDAAEAPAAPVAPVVTAAAISGKAGIKLAFGVTVKAVNPLVYSLSGAPAGMSISTEGLVTWATPLAGSYAVTVNAKDSLTGLGGKAVYTVTIAKALPPVIKAPALAGVAGKALSGTISVTDPANLALSISITGLPSGMSLKGDGASLALAWAKPVTGSYTLTIKASNIAGVTASLAMPVKISAK